MSKNYARSYAIVSTIMILGYLLSFVKQAVIAQYYGISWNVDAYTIAIQIPVTLFAFLSVAIHSIIVPLYSDILYNKGLRYARTFINNVITSIGIIALFVILIGEFGASTIIYIFAPGFDSASHQLSTELLRITLPIIIFTSISNILIAVVNVHKCYVWPSFTVCFLNIVTISFILLLHKNIGISAACVGQIIGTILNVGFLLFLARKCYRYSFYLNLKDIDLKRSLKMSLPVFWSIGLAEINAIVNRMVASFLFTGSIASLSYASKINSIFMTLLVSIISTIVYPLYAESSVKGNMEQLNHRVNTVFSIYVLFLIPAMLFIFSYRREFIEVAFARGVFDKNAIDKTQQLLGYYSIGLLFMGIRETITKVFYSLHNTITPSKNASIGVILNIILNLSLPLIFGVNGIALGTSITAIFISVRLTMQLLKKYEYIRLITFKENIAKIGISSIIMFITILVLRYYVVLQEAIISLLIGIGSAIIVYSISITLLKVPIAKTLMAMVMKRNK
jgi:putative peptidoglycan lipid II flippase